MTLRFAVPSLPSRVSLRRPLALLATVVLLPSGIALAQDAILDPQETEADITTSEEIQNHEGHTENIDRHEGRTENIDNHEGRVGNIDNHEEGSENIDAHEEGSETMHGRVVNSEQLEGMGRAPQTADERLAAARAKLAAARARHTQYRASHPPASADPAAPAASAADGDRWGEWTARIDVARHRVDVAAATVEVWDQSYADMIQSDYPRGEARQKLIDSRDQAKQRLAAEQANLPRVVEAARRAGVPPGVLELHAGNAAQ